MAEGKKSSPIAPVIGCLIVQLCVGIIYLWSVFKSSVVASYGWVEASATMVASYMMMGFVLGCLFGGLINDKKGPRFSCVIGIILFSLGVGLTGLLRHENISLIYLTYSVMGGLGAGLTYNACIPCIQKWMPDRRGLASVGPFNFPAGSVKELNYAMITVWKNNNLSALERKGEFIDHVRAVFNNGFAK